MKKGKTILFVCLTLMLGHSALLAQTTSTGTTFFKGTVEDMSETINATKLKTMNFAGYVQSEDPLVNNATVTCKGLEISKDKMVGCSICTVVDKEGDAIIYISESKNSPNGTTRLTSGTGKFMNASGTGIFSLEHATSDGWARMNWELSYSLN